MRWMEPAPLRYPDLLPDLHPLVAQTLVRRGMNTPEAARAFLDSNAYSPTKSSELPGLIEAVDRVERAIKQHDPICIWGDFDVDGQTSTTVLFQTLRVLDADITFHIPVRGLESHGVNIPFLKEIIGRGAKLILTCDTGVTANEAVEYARTCGVEMIITDHHDLPDILPQAFSVINPKMLPAGHPLSTLAGVGVAYKFAEELIAHFPTVDFQTDSLLDLVALGLVADLAILKGDARYLVQKGLVQLRNTKRLGLQVMMEMAELVPVNLTEEHIGFVLGPRLNALGRLGDANPAVELLTTTRPRSRTYVGDPTGELQRPASTPVQPGDPGSRSPITSRPRIADKSHYPARTPFLAWRGGRHRCQPAGRSISQTSHPVLNS